MPSRLQIMRETNQRLSLCLDRIASNPGATVTPDQMGALLSELLAAGAGLRAQTSPAAQDGRESTGELDHELAEYRRQVERLRDLLPSIHRTLLAERSRIEAHRFRLHSAGEWVRASRQTL